MTNETKIAAITALIETGRDAARFTNRVSESIAALCGVTDQPDQFALDYLYTGPNDVPAEEAARQLVAESEGE